MSVGWGCSACDLSEDGLLWICTEVCERRDVHAHATKEESEEAKSDWIHENDMDAC